MTTLEKPIQDVSTVDTKVSRSSANKQQPKVISVPLPKEVRDQMPETNRTFMDRTFWEVVFPNAHKGRTKKSR